MAGTDAVFQEVDILRAAFNGDTLNLFPLRKPSSRVPRQLYGVHKIPVIRRLEQQCKLNHLYFSVLYDFPILRLLRNPIVYTVVASLKGHNKPAGIERLKTLHRIVVSNERDAKQLESWGLSNHVIIPPAITTQGLVPGSLALDRELTLLMASAPWEAKQFDLKGIDLLLEAVARLPFLKLILLWRGLLFEDLVERVERHGIKGRVEIVNSRVKVNDYLRRAHATVLLAKRGDIVKSYPHSLMESLVANKPVLVSNTIPMADYVRQNQCGVVLDELRFDSLSAAIETLMKRYDVIANNAKQVDPDAFSIRKFVESHRCIYKFVARTG
jgi:glycosyltransferase involved in cell wall biosynthesis